MFQKSDTNLLHPALVNLTTQLFQDIIEHKINTPNFQCLGLQSIDYEQKENQIEVVLQFDIISSSSSALRSDDALMNDSYTKCNYTDILIRSSNQLNREERKSPFVTIVVCCCILTTFFLLVLFLRCRSFIRRKQMAKRRNHSKYLYCSDYPKPRPINHSYIKTDKAYYWSPVKSSHKNSLSLWPEGLSLKNNHNYTYNNCTSSSSSLNQSSHHMKKCHQHSSHSNGNYTSNSYFTQRQFNSSNDTIHKYRNNINIHNNSYKHNCQHHKGIRESENYLAAGYTEYYKRMNNTSKVNMNKPNSVIGMYQNTQRIQKPTQNQSHSSPIRNQSVFFNPQKLPRENEITDSETPTTEFTGSSKSHQSTSQIHVYRKGRSLSPAEITNSSESKFLFNQKPRFSLAESDEMSDKPIQMNRPSEFHDVIIDCSSLESAVTYPVQNTFSHTNPSQVPHSPLETRTYQSLMSVYLNDVAQQTRNSVHRINSTIAITPNASDNSIVSRIHNNVNNNISNNNNNVSSHSICLDMNGNTSHKNDTLPYKLNIPKIATGVFNDELRRMEKVNSFESNQSSFSLNNDDSIEQNNNTSAATATTAAAASAIAVLQGIQSPVVNEKPKRPALCLFSANKSHRHYHSNHRDHQKCHLRCDNSVRNDNMEQGNHHPDDVDEDEEDEINHLDNDMKQSLTSINTSMSKLPSINYAKRTSGSSSDINIDTVMNNSIININNNNLLCKMNECKSCMNLQAYELAQDRYRNPSSGSTISQAPRSDLPDVYLNPPSMSTLQSQRSSLCERSRMELLYVDNELERDNYSRHKLGTEKLISASHSEVDLTKQTNGGGDNWSLVDELVILPQPQKFGLLHNQTFHLRNTYHQPLPQSPLNLAPPSFKLFQLPDDNFGNLPVKDKEHHSSIQQHLRRALSLTSRRKSPRSLNAEIQSIMDKHYEMTGIRMTIGSGTTQKNTTTTKSYMNLFGSQFNTRIQSSRPRKRRCSWTFTKDITNEFQSGIKNVSSALHLDCTNFDLLQKIKQFREKPSVLESLSMTALPCLVPLRPRIRSDATNDMTVIDEEFIERRYHQKIHSDFIHPTKLSELKRNSMVAIDKSLSILGIQTNIRQVKSNLNLTNM
uniref:Uncharacterized protein n=1 Tax=Trichobilharzia regenti TaxID=157069 RepID=A0AA85JQV6_TRIRE|nr:unnamed protein product [Trichobilharzia regenti]